MPVRGRLGLEVFLGLFAAAGGEIYGEIVVESTRIGESMPLPRLQLFELEDLTSFPHTIRDLATDYLHFMETPLRTAQASRSPAAGDAREIEDVMRGGSMLGWRRPRAGHIRSSSSGRNLCSFHIDGQIPQCCSVSTSFLAVPLRHSLHCSSGRCHKRDRELGRAAYHVQLVPSLCAAVGSVGARKRRSSPAANWHI